MAHKPNDEITHRFGGKWTNTKLDVLKKYLNAYGTALKYFNFKRIYIDAFAGTGYRELNIADKNVPPHQGQLFQEFANQERQELIDSQELLDGSARIALNSEPQFHEHIFIEIDPTRVNRLNLLKNEFPDMRNRIKVYQGDANEKIQDLCGNLIDWKHHRAVLFLDPYGLQVEWKTIEAIARTRAIDLWLLFPLGVGVNRMLPRSGEIPTAWVRTLDRVFGTTEWRNEFFKRVENVDMFGSRQEVEKTATTETIRRFYIDRLKGLFPGVIENPGVLYNSTMCPLYLLCFAVGNENGKRTALKIARSLLKDI